VRTLAGALVLAVAAEPALAQTSGEKAFRQCYSCHSLDPAEQGLEGPTLAGVVGRRAGTLKGYSFSAAMKAAGARGLIWTEAALERYAADPDAVVPGSKMSYAGLKNAAARKALISYLKRSR
jgi:cytochrome c